MFSSFLTTRGSSQGQTEENRQALQAVGYETLERPPAHFFTPQAAQKLGQLVSNTGRGVGGGDSLRLVPPDRAHTLEGISGQLMKHAHP